MQKRNHFILKILLLGALLTAFGWAAVDHPVDINNATLEEIQQLPITSEQAQALYDRIYYQGPFQSIYELVLVPGIDNATLEHLKPLVEIHPIT